jgi:hypothetical protein
MKYKLIKLLPFENSPKIGYISQPHLSQKDEDHYWNGLWFNPENYPEFWQPVVEKNYEILSLVASEKNPQHKKGSKFLHNKDYKFKNMHPTEFWDIFSVKRISDNKIFTIGDFYEDLIIEKMFMSVAGDILTTYKPKIKKPLFTTEDGVDIFEGDYSYGVHNSKFDIVAIKHINTVYVTDNFIEFSTKEKAEEYIIDNKPCLSVNDVAKIFVSVNYTTNKGNLYPQGQKLRDLVKSKIQQSV